MKVIQSIVKIDTVLGESDNSGVNLVDLIQDFDLEGHSITVDEDDHDVLVFSRYYND